MDEFKKDLKDVEKNILSMLHDLQQKYDINIEDIETTSFEVYGGRTNKVIDVKIKFDVK